MAIRNIRRQATNPLAAPGQPNSAPIYVDSDDNILKMIPAGSGTTEVQVVDASSVQTLTNKTLSAPTINGHTGLNNAEVVSATNVIAGAESGSTFYLNSATEFVSTLPAPLLGMKFTFIVAAAPSGASYTVITSGASGGANIMVGHILTSQDAGGSADSETSGGDTLSFVDGKAVVGDRATFESDGTSWFVQASSKVFDAITITTTA